jgi:uncharacterized protein YegL
LKRRKDRRLFYLGGDDVEEKAICVSQKCEAIIEAQACISNLISWQQQQNGTIREVTGKVDTLYAKIDDKFQTLFYWILGTLVTVCLSLMGTLLLIIRSPVH